MAWGWKPYVRVAQREGESGSICGNSREEGHKLVPVRVTGRNIATTFWGKAWCENLESYSDFANRLPRGQTYLRNGSVIDLQVNRGHVTAQVSGSDIYRVEVKIRELGFGLENHQAGLCRVDPLASGSAAGPLLARRDGAADASARRPLPLSPKKSRCAAVALIRPCCANTSRPSSMALDRVWTRSRNCSSSSASTTLNSSSRRCQTIASNRLLIPVRSPAWQIRIWANCLVSNSKRQQFTTGEESKNPMEAKRLAG